MKRIWDDQKKFNRNFVDFGNLTQSEKETHTKDYCLQLLGEVSELLREINYKTHRKNHQVIESNLKEEWIDIFKYWLSLGVLWGWDFKDFEEEYVRKSKVVEQRFGQELGKDWNSETKCVALDIDGVLADYPLSFQNFIKQKTGAWVNLKGYDLYHEYGEVIGQERIRELKQLYRESGQKRHIPLCGGAKALCDEIHSKGYRIIFLTSRPYKQYSRIFADTMEWLEKNGLKREGDAIIFDEEKNYKAIREFPSIEFMVEDNSKFAMNIAKLGYKVYLVDKNYNQGTEHENIKRIMKLGEINV